MGVEVHFDHYIDQTVNQQAVGITVAAEADDPSACGEGVEYHLVGHFRTSCWHGQHHACLRQV